MMANVWTNMDSPGSMPTSLTAWTISAKRWGPCMMTPGWTATSLETSSGGKPWTSLSAGSTRLTVLLGLQRTTNGIWRSAVTTRALEPRSSRRDPKSGARWSWMLRWRTTGLRETSLGRSGALMPTEARKSSLGWSVLTGSETRTMGNLRTVVDISASVKPYRRRRSRTASACAVDSGEARRMESAARAAVAGESAQVDSR
uniref:Uncharacterized protein n=1 Tax=Triticum urartu TaxID=4572 RepID=A0A8R7K0V6_TRIUA